MHQLADSLTIEASLVEWIGTFESLSRKPESLNELIRSATLYQALMEVEPEMFPPLPPKLLSKDPNCLTLDSARTRKIYQELLFRMEEWFKVHGEDLVF